MCSNAGVVLHSFTKRSPLLPTRASARTVHTVAQDVDRSAVAMAWLLAHPAGIVPVAGSNDLARIARFSDAFRVGLDRQEWFEIYTAALGRDVA